MTTETTVDLVRTRRNSAWWSNSPYNDWMCHDTFVKKVELDEQIREIRLEAVKRPSANTFEVAFTKKNNPYFVEFPRTFLMYPLKRFMRQNYKAGRKYIRVTYIPKDK